MYQFSPNRTSEMILKGHIKIGSKYSICGLYGIYTYLGKLTKVEYVCKCLEKRIKDKYICLIDYENITRMNSQLLFSLKIDYMP